MLQIGIIKNVRYGYTDSGVGLSFSTFISENKCADQFLNSLDSADLILKYGISDIRFLEGKPCWVEVGNNMIVYEKPCIIS